MGVRNIAQAWKLQRAHDLLQHAIDILEDLVVPEADHAITLAVQPARSRLILRRSRVVLAAVDFDDQPRLQAAEVNDVVADCLPDWKVIVDVERGSMTPIGGPETQFKTDVN